MTFIMAKECFDHLCKPTDNNMENFHNGVHSYIGGTMNAAPCSPSDPVFWLHHANVDCLWEQYRQEVQDPAKRTLEYPLVDVAQESNLHFFHPFFVHNNCIISSLITCFLSFKNSTVPSLLIL